MFSSLYASPETTNTKRWITGIAKVALVVWLVVQMTAFATTRIGIFYAAASLTSDRMFHAAINCGTTCAEPGATNRGPNLVDFCTKECEIVHLAPSPTMEGLRAVADATYLCGSKPCLETFGIVHLLATIGLLYAARILVSLSVSYAVHGREHKKST
jgi:hypothetical protein